MRFRSTSSQILLVALMAALITAVFPLNALAKAAYFDEARMVAMADVIAIVSIARVEEKETKAEPFDFRQVARATVEQTLKGELPATVTLYGMEAFICAHVEFAPGRFLVFLHRSSEGLLSGCNWHLSVRPMKGDLTEWYRAGGANVRELSWQPTSEVLEKVRSLVALPAGAATR